MKQTIVISLKMVKIALQTLSYKLSQTVKGTILDTEFRLLFLGKKLIILDKSPLIEASTAPL